MRSSILTVVLVAAAASTLSAGNTQTGLSTSMVDHIEAQFDRQSDQRRLINDRNEQ